MSHVLPPAVDRLGRASRPPRATARGASLAPLLGALLAIGCSSGGSPAAPGGPSGSGIGPAGGRVTSADGQATLVVPPGALATTTDLVITATTPSALDPAVVGGSTYAISPAGLAFAVPATLVVHYADAQRISGVDEGSLRLARLDNAGTWQPLTSTVAPAGDSATGTLGATGTVSVRWPGPATACGTATFRQFDFYVGRWAFSAPNSFPGSDIVTLDATGCVLREDFVDSQGVRGASLSLYDPATAQWHQTYIDSQGGRLVLRGTLVGGTMLLYETPGMRYGWSVLSATQLRFYAERSTNGGASWTVVFDGRYTAVP
ncbi:MAG: hypothetical protein HY275_14945 [Gemmatimonadetes bacterium]|nr:hypothetical protein [Gemmatimonadota bacterium]